MSWGNKLSNKYAIIAFKVVMRTEQDNFICWFSITMKRHIK